MIHIKTDAYGPEIIQTAIAYTSDYSTVLYCNTIILKSGIPFTSFKIITEKDDELRLYTNYNDAIAALRFLDEVNTAFSKLEYLS